MTIRSAICLVSILLLCGCASFAGNAPVFGPLTAQLLGAPPAQAETARPDGMGSARASTDRPALSTAPAASPDTDLSDDEADGPEAATSGEQYPFLEDVEEEPLVNEELPETNPDAVLRSGSPQADRIKKQAEAIKDEIRHEISFDIPIVLNERVAYFLDYFQTVVRERFSIWLARSTKYLPRMKQIFRQQGLPEDLVYLALIESGFNPRAVSRSAAVGPWQFISATGSRYGLRQDRWVDERRDFEKATFAAAAYLTGLHNEFGSWYLAAAAYNCGEGRIRRVIRNLNTQDYWEMCDQQAIARETRDYVPEMIAAILIAKEPHKYGFGNVCFETPNEWDIAELGRPTDLRLVAELCGTDPDVLKELNPELRHNWTPPAGSGAAYKLRVPAGSKDQLLARLEERSSWMARLPVHRVRRGETLAKIARSYGCSVQMLATANDLSAKSRVHRGQKLVVPISMAEMEARAAERATRDDAPQTVAAAAKTHSVHRGETLTRIARHYDLSVAQLKDLNPGLKGSIQPGQKLVVGKQAVVAKADRPERSERNRRAKTAIAKTAIARTHTVDSGETLCQIARQYDVDMATLRDLNPDLGQTIHPGDKVVVRKVERVVAADASPQTRRVRTYRVKVGDTLWNIARRYNVEVSELRSWNSLGKGENIRPGDRIKVKTEGGVGG